MQCQQCGEPMLSKTATRKWCPTCADLKTEEHRRARNDRKRNAKKTAHTPEE